MKMGSALLKSENSLQPGPVVVPIAQSRWLHVVSHLDPRYGGLSAAVPALGETLAKDAGCRIQVAAFCTPGENFQPASFDARNLSFWPHGRGSWLHNEALRRDFAGKVAQADGVHIHGLWEHSTAEACSAAVRGGKPYVLSAHGMLEPWALRQKWLKKMIYAALTERGNVRGAACCMALTADEARDYRRFGVKGPIAVIPNGVAIPKQRNPAAFLDLFPALLGKRIVLFLGRLHRKKGLDLLLDAWSQVAPLHSDAHLVIAGPDPEDMRGGLEDVVAQHGLTHQVLFTGMIQDELKWSALAAAEAFILPSHSEGLSVSILEAMGMGLPVIITEQCHMPEVVDYEAGWVVQPRRKDLIEVLTELLETPVADNSALGANGSRLVEQRYSWPAIARQTAQVYRWVLGGSLPQNVELDLW